MDLKYRKSGTSSIATATIPKKVLKRGWSFQSPLFHMLGMILGWRKRFSRSGIVLKAAIVLSPANHAFFANTELLYESI